MTKKDIVQQEITDILENQWAAKPLSEEYALGYFRHQYQHDDGYNDSWVTTCAGWVAKFPKAAKVEVK